MPRSCMIPVLGSPNAPPMVSPPSHAWVQTCRIPVTAHISPTHGSSKSVNCHENLVPNTPDAYDSGHLPPRLRHECIKNATVTCIAFLTGPLPVTVDPRKERDDDDDAKPLTLSKTPNRKTMPHHRGGGEPLQADPNRTTPRHRGGKRTRPQGGGGGTAEPGSCIRPVMEVGQSEGRLSESLSAFKTFHDLP